jgi:hypothetical protein
LVHCNIEILEELNNESMNQWKNDAINKMKTRILTAAIALPLLIASIVLPIYVPQTVWIFVTIAGHLARDFTNFIFCQKNLNSKRTLQLLI